MKDKYFEEEDNTFDLSEDQYKYIVNKVQKFTNQPNEEKVHRYKYDGKKISYDDEADSSLKQKRKK